MKNLLASVRVAATIMSVITVFLDFEKDVTIGIMFIGLMAASFEFQIK